VLTELRVRDLAVIADVSLQLSDGLNVITGATGAGKSMLIDALALLLGERASADVVRPGAEKTVVEGAFDLSHRSGSRAAIEALGIEWSDGVVVVKREIFPEGRSRAWVNGSPATVGVLAQLGGLLVDLHGQHETQSLLRADVQRELLDAFGDAHVERVAVRDAFARWKALEEQAATLVARQDDVRRKADYLRHVVQEIGAAAPKVGEDDALEGDVRRLANADELGRLAREIEASADTAALARASRILPALERLDPATAKWRELVDTAYANLDELSAAARAYATGVDTDPARLAELERRRDVLYRLKQKHGPTIPDVLATRDGALRELELLDTADLDVRRLAEERDAAAHDVTRACAALTAKRRGAAQRLAGAVNRMLPALGLEGGRLEPTLEPLTAPRADGAESVSFLVRLNVGLEARPLARVASGGELSRLMLALKVALAAHDAVPTLVFDEVDQGIGGEVGGRVAAALHDVAGAGRRQVLVITHLPQIAARADHHLVVAKGTKRGVATSDVTVVTAEERRREIARLLGDQDLEVALRHATELLKTGGTSSAGRSGTPSSPARPPRGR
jgi:DNA repair protein RecN (Recombination protein N)